MQVGISETLGAVQGGTAAAGVVDALDRMGITARIMNGEITTSDGLLDAIAQSAGSFATEAQFTASVVDVLGRKIGIDLAAAVRDGGSSLHQLEDDFRSAGNVLDTEVILRLAKANESIEGFMTVLSARVAITLSNVLRDIAAVGRALSSIGDEGFFTTLANENSKIRSRDLETRMNASLINNDANSLSAFRALRPATPPRRVGPAEAPARRTGAAPRASAEPRGPARSLRPEASAADRLADARASQFEGVAAGLTAEAATPLSGMTTQFEQIQEAAVRAGEGLAEGFSIGEELSRNISRNLAQGIVFGNNIGAALVNSFKAAAAEALASGLFDLLRGAIGSSGGGGILGSIVTVLGASFGGARAAGGPVGAGRAYLVRERGPELFVPSAAGAIVANNRLGGGSGSTVHVNVDARGSSDPAAVERAAFTAFLAARQYTDAAFDARSRVRLARGAGAA